MFNARLSLLAACSMLLITACETTSTTAVWKDPGYAAQPMRSMMVIGVSQNSTNRRLYEDAMVNALVSKGVAAQASYAQIPDANNINKQSVEAAIEGQSVDGVLVTHVLGIDTETVYEPPMRRYGRPHYGRYHSYYAWAYDDVLTPGYYRTYRTARLETNVYAVSSGDLAWSMHSKTLDPENVARAIDSVVAAVIERMQNDGLI